MSKTSEARIRKLEREHRPPPYPEESFKHCTEGELVAMRDAARAAVAGDAEAAAELVRLLALTDSRKGLIDRPAFPRGELAPIARRNRWR